MEFKLTLSTDHINIVLRQLDQGPHAQVRAVIDAIIQQVNAQQQPAPAVEDTKKPEEAPAA